MLRNIALGKKGLQIHSVSIDTCNTSIAMHYYFQCLRKRKSHIPQMFYILSDNSADKQANSSIQFDKIKWNHYNLWINLVNKDWLSQQIKVQQERVGFWKTSCTYFTTKLGKNIFSQLFHLEEYFNCTKSSFQERFTHQTLSKIHFI